MHAWQRPSFLSFFLSFCSAVPVTTLNRLLGLPSRAQVEEKFAIFCLSPSCLIIQKDASLHGLPLSDCFFTRVRYRLTALNEDASLSLEFFSLLRDGEENKKKRKGKDDAEEEEEVEEAWNQEKEEESRRQKECKKEDDKTVLSRGGEKSSSSSLSPRMQMDFEYEVIFTKSTFLQVKRKVRRRRRRKRRRFFSLVIRVCLFCILLPLPSRAFSSLLDD